MPVKSELSVRVTVWNDKVADTMLGGLYEAQIAQEVSTAI